MLVLTEISKMVGKWVIAIGKGTKKPSCSDCGQMAFECWGRVRKTGRFRGSSSVEKLKEEGKMALHQRS